MTCISAVGVNDYLSSCQAAVALRTADNKSACGIYEILCVNKQLCGDNRLDDLFDNILSYLFESDLGSVLRGNDNSINSYGLAVIVFNCYLSLSIGTEIGENARLSYLGQLLCKLVGKRDGHRHKLGSFVARIAEHHSLIACACLVVIVNIAVTVLESLVNAHCDIGGLLVYGSDNGAGVTVKAVLCTVVADVDNYLSYDLGDINVTACGDLTHAHYETCGGSGFAGNSSHWVLCQYSVKNSVRDLVADLIGMSFCN